ncbi:hypothetical protein VTL71DRAFT_15310 [Oculimacula yallundae]|uniref:Uncharacterized protein n=1 Tax=Oculimacula yallundae TaxID=86028 RepID=A0ABR4CHI0_9HELO
MKISTSFTAKKRFCRATSFITKPRKSSGSCVNARMGHYPAISTAPLRLLPNSSQEPVTRPFAERVIELFNGVNYEWILALVVWTCLVAVSSIKLHQNLNGKGNKCNSCKMHSAALQAFNEACEHTEQLHSELQRKYLRLTHQNRNHFRELLEDSRLLEQDYEALRKKYETVKDSSKEPLRSDANRKMELRKERYVRLHNHLRLCFGCGLRAAGQVAGQGAGQAAGM